MNILDTIAQKTKERIRIQKKLQPPAQIRTLAEQTTSPLPPFAFYHALQAKNPAFICEVKKASPSKGIIAAEFPYLQIAKEYEAAGASAVSCLTEPFWFLGQDQYLQEISSCLSIPVLRKDFTVDEYMIYQAKVLGASAILLICAILDDHQLSSYHQLSRELGLSVLTEVHTEEEIERALKSGASVIGINNRNLKNFHVDLTVSSNLRKQIPSGVLLISESGIRTPQDIQSLHSQGINGFLIGETLMRSPDRKKTLTALRGIKNDKN